MRTLLIPGLSIIVILAWVSACSQSPPHTAEEWPPLVGWAKQNFQESRASLEMLESMLLASKYEKVVRSDVTVGKYPGPNGEEEEIITNNEDWVAHMRKASVFAVSQDDGYTAYPTGRNPFSPNIVSRSRHYEEIRASDAYKNMLVGTLAYIHLRSTDVEEVECQARFSESKCGACAVTLAPDWLAHYTWSAASFTRTGKEPDSDSTLSKDEIEARSRQAYESCSAKWQEMIASKPE
jgi:hypothetical protein